VKVSIRGSGAAKTPDPRPEIARVAHQLSKDLGTQGYGDTWYHEQNRAVFWSPGDWNGTEDADEAERRFLAIPGVDRFDWDCEVGDPGGPGWEAVYPPARTEAALAEVVALAAKPLDGELTPDDFARYGQGEGDRPGWKT
jgi:hypothetical protein